MNSWRLLPEIRWQSRLSPVVRWDRRSLFVVCQPAAAPLLALLILLLNLSLNAPLFMSGELPFRGSVEGGYVSMARFLSRHPNPWGWNPFPYCGLPVQFMYVPALPYLSALGIRLLPHVSPDLIFRSIVSFAASQRILRPVRTAMLDKRGLKDYRTLGYVPANKGSQAVSKTLEYAYDDWCIAQMAKALGKQDDYDYFIARSQFYRNIYDPSVGFMRGKDDAHAWSQPFDPQAPGLNYTEGNAYQYSLFAPQDVPGLIQLLGGKARLAAYLDTLFTKPMTLDLGDEDDISGLIGQYAHGNEPSHHLAYFYCFAGEPWKTQAMVRRILKEQYSDTPAGLNGNDDCGQISAWYVISALGFYAVCPGQPGYVIGSPLFNRATLRLPQGTTFTIQAANNSPQNVYIQSARLKSLRASRSMMFWEVTRKVCCSTFSPMRSSGPTRRMRRLG